MLVALCPICSKAKNYCQCSDGNTPMKSVQEQILDDLLELFNAGFIYGELGKGVGDVAEAESTLAKINSIQHDGIPLKRVVGLWEQGKLVQLDEDQRWPDNPHDFTDRQRRLHFYECHDRCHAAEQEAAEEAGFKRVTEIRGCGGAL